MKQINYSAFGGPEVLQLTEVEKPSIHDIQVLIKVAATTVNPLDMKIRSGNMQKVMPVELPFHPGLDAAGTIEAVGAGVSRLKVGDEVFANTGRGSYAEYIAVKEDHVSLKPANISVNEAASLVVPIVTAYTLLVDTAQLQGGQKILVHGAAGAVGSVVVQMAKAIGAYVIGTASGDGLDLVRSLGVDEVIDYKAQDFTQVSGKVDIVADLVGGETQAKSFAIIERGGQLISTVMPPSQELAEQAGVRAVFINSLPSFKKLDYGKHLVEQGLIKPVIAKVLPLEQAAEAQALVSAGGLNGKVVLEVA